VLLAASPASTLHFRVAVTTLATPFVHGPATGTTHPVDCQHVTSTADGISDVFVSAVGCDRERYEERSAGVSVEDAGYRVKCESRTRVADREPASGEKAISGKDDERVLLRVLYVVMSDERSHYNTDG